MLTLVSLGLVGCGGGGGSGGSDPTSPNQPPVITGLLHTTPEDSDLATTLIASDPEGAAVTFTHTTEPAHGGLTQFQANGAFTYHPDFDFFGDDSFTVQAEDDAGNRVTATVQITVTAVSDAPRGNDVALTTNEDTPASGHVAATDPEGDAVTFVKVADSPKGLVTVAANGDFTYSPRQDANGPDTFEIEARDAGNVASRITVNVTIAPVNDAPQAHDDFISVPAGNPVILDVLANDIEPDGEPLTLTVEPGTLYFGQSATAVNGHIEVTMPTSFVGFARVDYRAEDATGGSSSASAVFFVDTQPLRVVYTSNEETGRFNAYIDDLAHARRVSNFDATSSLSLGPTLVSKNGATIIYEAGTFGVGSYTSREMWTAPVDGSASPRRITPELQTGEVLHGRSLISPNGRWMVYGISVGSTETLYLADLNAGGSSTQIPLPAGATRIESDFNGLVFGPTSRFLYYSASFGSGSQRGMATYRLALSNPTAPPLRLSAPAAAGRFAGILSIASDDSRVLESSFANGAWTIERVDIAQLGAVITLTTLESLPAGQSLTGSLANDALTRIAYVVQTEPTPGTFAYALHAADVATAQSGVQIADLPYIGVSPPLVTRIHPSGDAVLYFTTIDNGGPQLTLNEIGLSPAATPLIMSYGVPDPVADYIGQNSELVAYRGISGLVQQQERGEQFNFRTIGTQISAVHGFSPDTNVLALIGAPQTAGQNQLFLTNRSVFASVQLTGLIDPANETQLIGLVPRN